MVISNLQIDATQHAFMNWQRSSTGRIRLVSAILLLTFLLTGCVSLYDPEASQEYNQQIVATLDPENSIGQTIHTNRPRPSHLTIWLSRESSTSSPSDVIIVRLHETLSSAEPFFATSISAAAIDQFSPLQISLSSVDLSAQDTFYLELSTTSGLFQVHGRQEDIYSFGQAYLNRATIDADLAFRLSYTYDWNAFRSDLQTWSHQIGLIIPLLLTVWLPGFTLLRIFKLHKNFSGVEQAALSFGLSLAAIPLLYLLLSLLIIPISRSLLWFLIGLCCSIILVQRLIQQPLSRLIPSFRNSLRSIFQSPLTRILYRMLPGVAITIIFLVTLFTRLAMVRDLATPVWVDSFHHALITRLIIDQGALPATYEPYLDIEPTLYHPGFHTALAVFLQLSGSELSHGMLFYGQFLNALVIFSVYLLTSSLTRSRTAGLFAALIVGVFTPMPAYYTSWGRYTQLAGLIILPVPFVLFQRSIVVSTTREAIRFLVPAALAVAGLFMVHYRTAAFFACLLFPYLGLTFFSARNSPHIPVRSLLMRFAIFSLLAIIISLPWLLPAVQQTFLPRISPLRSAEPIPFFSDFSWQYLDTALGKQSLIMAFLGLGWAALRRRKFVFILLAWVISLFFLSNLDALKLPGGAFINNSSVTIMLFIPIAAAGGYFLSQLVKSWKSVIPGFLQPCLWIIWGSLLVTTTIIGTRQLLPILNPGTILTRQADLAALQWIDQNVPDDRTILINPFAWGYGLYAAADGGAWIPALAGNPTLPPTVLYGLGSEAQKTFVNQLCADLFRLGDSPAELWQYLVASNIEYIYVGARGGPIFPTLLAEDSHFQVLYHADNTWVFRISP